MNERAAANPKCPECGAVLAATTPRGLCSRCLVLNVLALDPSPPSREFEPLPLEELRDAFPDLDLRRVLGRGGMGTVYEAWQRSLSRAVALKLLPVELLRSEDFLERFQREARLMARLDHQNIARVYGNGITDDGQAYIVMELVNGEPVNAYVSTHNLSLEAKLDLFAQVCAGVQHAHQKGIIHRDLKPSNILVTVVDGRPTPKLVDFGLAKPSNQTASDEAEWLSASCDIGTPAYMSPEQVSGSDIDSRSDIYSLGILLYEMLTGRPPFDDAVLRSNQGPVLREFILNTPIQKPSEAVANLRGDLDAIVLKATDKRPDHRYQSAAAIPEDIQRHIDHQPVAAMPATNTYLARKFCRRHRPSLAVVATFVLLLLGAGGVLVRDSFLIRRAERLASTRLQHGERLIEFMLGDLQGKLEAVGRLDIMEGTLNEVERFYADSPGSVPPESLFNRARAVRRIGMIRHAQGQTAAARADYEQSIQLLTQALASNPMHLPWIEELGQTWNSLAVFHHGQTQIPEATRAYNEALRLAGILATREPRKADWLDFKASVLHNFAALLEMSGHWDEAEQGYSEALQIWQPLQRASPDNQQLLDHVSQLYQSVAFVQAKRGKPEEARRSNEQALVLRKRLLELDPKNIRGLDLLADIEQNIAEFHFQREELAEAESWMDRYRPKREQLAAHDPANLQWRNKLAEAWENYGLIEDRLDHREAATAARNRAREIRGTGNR